MIHINRKNLRFAKRKREGEEPIRYNGISGASLVAQW